MTLPINQRADQDRRRGVVLIAVLIVVALLMLVGYQFYNLMNAEHEAVYASNRVNGGRLLADSGIHYAAFVLAYPQNAGLGDADGSPVVSPAAIYDNPSVFHFRPVSGSGAGLQGYFSIVATRDLDDPLAATQGFRFGVVDEGGKLNVGALLRLDRSGRRPKEMLLKLPGVTEEMASAILNWTRTSGGDESANADALYYSALGYTLKRGPFESPDELLLIRGMTPRLFFGNDRNRNGLLEPEEDEGDGFLDPGLSQYLTIHSRERNLDSDGQARIYLNETDLNALYDKLNPVLGEELTNFIIALRINGPVDINGVGDGNSVGDGGSSRRGRNNEEPENPSAVGKLIKDDLGLERGRRGAQNITSVFSLIGAEVRFTRPGEREPTRFLSPLQKGELDTLREALPLLLDKTTTSQDQEIAGRVSLNTAPREVLLTLPGFTEADVQVILDHRPAPDLDPAQAIHFRTLAWLVTEAGFEPTKVTEVEPYVTTRSQVFRFQVVGYYQLGGPSVRLEAVVDANGGRPRILYWRDLSELGRGFNLQNAPTGSP